MIRLRYRFGRLESRLARLSREAAPQFDWSAQEPAILAAVDRAGHFDRPVEIHRGLLRLALLLGSDVQIAANHFGFADSPIVAPIRQRRSIVQVGHYFYGAPLRAL